MLCFHDFDIAARDGRTDRWTGATLNVDPSKGRTIIHKPASITVHAILGTADRPHEGVNSQQCWKTEKIQ